MIDCMTERRKLQATVDERIHRALAIRAAKRGVEIGDLIQQLVEANFGRELEDADESLQDQPAAKRRRKPQSEV